MSSTPRQFDYDTVIIGAGMSGLAAGIRLAYYDQRVCILERHTTIGGLNSFYRLDGRNYDVGLHAVTNFTPKGAKKGPLARLLRQLRISWDEWSLLPQIGSRIAFPGASLRFNNDFEFFRAEVHRAFPKQKDNFEQLLTQIADYDDLDFSQADRSAREVVSSTIGDPLLVEMLFCPLMYYGSAREGDMDFAQFSIMFRSIFFEGLGRPAAGVRLILKTLVRRFRALGGELRLRAGVSRLVVDDGQIARIVLDDGSEITAGRVLSSAGWCETMRLCGDTTPAQATTAGQLSFCESMSVLDCQPRELGYDETIVFFNDSDTFHWQRAADLVDVRSGVICSPNNFVYDEPPAEGLMRATVLANYDGWRALAEPDYRLAKLEWYDRILESVVRFVPDFRGHVIGTDMFTPTTIQRFTGHDNGAVYGAAKKHYDGTTHLKNLFICGTDQGFVGIIGAIISGITMANKHLLKAE
jgi:phytoene dehydrogenase-like protein